MMCLEKREGEFSREYKEKNQENGKGGCWKCYNKIEFVVMFYI